MLALMASVTVASLLGSLHCLGMCGGFVTFYAGHESNKRQLWLSHLTYNLGRLLTYSVLGALSGLAGAALSRAGVAFGFSDTATYLAGGIMILWGIALFVQLSGMASFHDILPSGMASWATKLYQKAQQKPPIGRAFLLGTFSTLLPCGWLYFFAITASATASVWGGILVMFAFWLGTVPYMLSLGWSVQWLGGRLRRHVPWLSATVVLFLGIFTVAQRLWMPSLSEYAKREELAKMGIGKGAQCHPIGRSVSSKTKQAAKRSEPLRRAVKRRRPPTLRKGGQDG